MSERDREKWDGRYSEPGYRMGNGPKAYLRAVESFLPTSGTALDLACGEGQTLAFLADRGLSVTGVDISSVGLRTTFVIRVVGIIKQVRGTRNSFLLRGKFAIVGIEPLGGAMGRVPSSATAFGHREPPFSFGIWTGWADPSDDAACIDWTRRFHDAVSPYGAGAYVNYLGEDEGDRVGEAYGENFARLVEVKAKWDPENLFRLNHNIRPG